MMLATGRVVDRYEVLGELGQGGMASVYTVRHARLGSTHVLKVLTVRSGAIAERLLLEGQVQARLKHPNVVEVTDVIEIDGSPGLIMEYVQGPTLDAVVAARRLTLDEVRELAPGLFAGVAAAHAQGVVHRDLKPANVLLSLARGRVVPKVADFGLVKELSIDPSQARTRTGAAMGTPQYMAPEQIDSAKDVDARADVWALGAILYELVTGQRAFDGETHYQIFQRVVSRDFVPVDQLVPDAPPAMVATIHAALRVADERPASIEALWQLWQPDQPLELAAASAVSWPEGTLAGLQALSPTIVPTGSGEPASQPAVTSKDTFVDVDVEAPAPTSSQAPATLSPAASLPPPAPPSRARWLPLAAVVALLGVGVLGTLGLGFALVVIGSDDAAPTPQSVVAMPDVPAPKTPPTPTNASTGSATSTAPTPAPAPGSDEPPAPPPVDTGRASPAPPVAPVAAPTPVRPPPPEPPPTLPPAPTPPPVDAAPASEATTTGTVQLSGDVHLELRGQAGSFPPGPVPAGTYDLIVSDPTRTRSEPAGRIEVAAGQVVVVQCESTFFSCNSDAMR